MHYKNIIYLLLFPLLLWNCTNKTPVSTVEESKKYTSTTQTKQVKRELKKEKAIHETPRFIIPPFQLIPDGYYIYDKTAGDLNKDGVMDSVFIIKKIDTNNIVINRFEDTVDRNRRGLMVFFNKNGKWEVALQNLKCFSSENEDGGVYYAPELSVYPQKGSLFINYAHGRYGYWTFNFRYDNTGFELIGYDNSYNFGPVVREVVSINYLTKKLQRKVNTNQDDEGNAPTFKETWEDIDISKPIYLSKIKDFDNFDVLTIPTE